MIDTTEIIGRQALAIKEHGLDALVSMSPENATYTAGFVVPSQTLIRTRLVSCVVFADGDSMQIVADMEESFAKVSSSLAEVRAYNEFTENPADLLADALVEKRAEAIAIEMDYVPAYYLNRLLERIPGLKVVDAGPILARLRAIKTAEEIVLISKAAQLAEAAHHEAATQVRAGMTEMDLAMFVYESLLRNGADGVARLVVGSGERSTHANPGPTDRRLEPGDVVRVDIFATIDGYLSDIARTYVVGEPTKDQLDLWQKMLDSRANILSMIRPGVETGEIYKSFSDQFRGWGLEPLKFVGHGIGLSLHEEPYIGMYGDLALEENMMLCIEPYVTFPTFDFQVEDTLLVTSSGYKLATGVDYPLDLLVIKA